MSKVKEIIEILSKYKDDAILTDHENQPFIHVINKSNGDVILSTEKPIGYCDRSSGYVYPTTVEDYIGVSPELDENVDSCEIILPNLKEEENPNKFGEPIKRESKYKEAFYTLLKEVKKDLPQSSWEKLYKLDINLENE